MLRRRRASASRVLATMLVTLTLCSLGATPSFASRSSASHPVNPLSVLARVDVTTNSTALGKSAAVAARGTTAAAANVRCWSISISHSGKNALGGTLFTFTTTTVWCGDGTTVQTKASTSTSHSTAFGWTYEGLEQNYNKWGVGYSKFYSMRQGQFCLLNCLAGNTVFTHQPLVGPSGQLYSD